jgi:CheY-like chemotaxis protein
MTDSKKRILVAEDDPQISFILRSLLENEGHMVETVDSGLEVKSKALSFVPDVILLDLIMPHADGYEALDDLKKDSATERIPVILITGMVEDRDRGLRAGASGFLTKPVKGGELLEAIKKAI